MVLEPDILAEESDHLTARLRLRVPPDLVHFDGHFPGAPVLPGVVQIDWAMRLAQRCFGAQLLSHGIEQLKFLAVVGPGAELDLVLRREAAVLRFEYRRSGRIVSSATMLLGEPV